MLEESEVTALAAQRRGITGRNVSLVNEDNGKQVLVTQWGTERTYVEETEMEGMYLLCLRERNSHGVELLPVALLLTLEDLIELDLVTSVYLDGYVKEQLGVREVGE